MKRLIVFVLAALLLAGCAEAADSASGTADGEQEAGLKYARCMRENGVPNFEDPKFDEEGQIESLSMPKGTDIQIAEAAHEKCKEHLPDGGEPEKMNPEDVKKIRAYAKCMRENGMPDYPDPDSEGRTRFESGTEPDPDDPDLKAAHEKCGELLPGGGGGGPVIMRGGK